MGGGEHDWAYLLGEAGWLARDAALARGVHATGVALFVGSLALGLTTVRRPDADAARDASQSPA